MCGFVGLITHKLERDAALETVEAMKSTIQHRGPDGHGTHADSDHPVYLGHQRLSIIDPENGHQPMLTQDGSLTIVFNGAIYNYVELKEQLVSLGQPIQSSSDTEVLLYAYRQWGEDCLEKLRGMFAFCIWDKPQQRLFCARDRLGIKPFYYYFDGETFITGSEIKALLASRLFDKAINPKGLKEYATLQYCLADRTLLKDIHKLEPGYALTVQLHNDHKLSLHKREYWDLAFNLDLNKTKAQHATAVKEALEEAVQIHLRSDVPLGAHLSGGIDSGSIVSIAASQLGKQQLTTFTGAFPEGEAYDETKYAKLVADKAGADFHEIYITENNLAEYFPKLMWHMDEPLAGPGLIPQYFVSKYAANHVKVVLGGQGGDELFAGYARYGVAQLEQFLKGALAGNETSQQGLIHLSPNLPVYEAYIPMLKRLFSNGLFGDPCKRYYSLLDRTENNQDLFNPDIFAFDHDVFAEFQAIFNKHDHTCFLNKMLYYDIKTSLPALLHVEDRTSMAASLESRVPILDHKLVELSATIPGDIKFDGGNLKATLKQAVKNYLPDDVLHRKEKMGFPIPIQQWLSGPSEEFASAVFSHPNTLQGTYIQKKAVDKLLASNCTFSRATWGALSLLTWVQTLLG